MTTTVQTNVVVLSQSELYRDAWKTLLGSLPFVHLVETTTAVSDISSSSQGGLPATILVDAPGSEHRIALQIGSLHTRWHTCFVVNDYELHTILPLLKLGVTGFTARSDSISKFTEVFLASARGQIALPPDVAKRATLELASDARRSATLRSDLTQRETEVLQLLSAGMSNQDIAQRLFLSVRTVEAHLRNLYGKLDVNSRTEAALLAVRYGYAPLT
jgi:DNA-binding NarL/FixJ family response regulator